MMNWIRYISCLLLFGTMSLPGAEVVSAQAYAQPIQGPFVSLNVRGVTLNCVAFGGDQAVFYLNPNLQNVGIATRMRNGQPIIVLNPNVIGRYSNTVAVWWVAHECAHHALPPHLNGEPNADCFAAKKMVQLGLLRDVNQLRAFSYELANLQGSMRTGHLPGPVRARNIANCALS